MAKPNAKRNKNKKGDKLIGKKRSNTIAKINENDKLTVPTPKRQKLNTSTMYVICLDLLV